MITQFSRGHSSTLQMFNVSHRIQILSSTHLKRKVNLRSCQAPLSKSGCFDSMLVFRPQLLVIVLLLRKEQSLMSWSTIFFIMTQARTFIDQFIYWAVTSITTLLSKGELFPVKSEIPLSSNPISSITLQLQEEQCLLKHRCTGVLATL